MTLSVQFWPFHVERIADGIRKIAQNDGIEIGHCFMWNTKIQDYGGVLRILRRLVLNLRLVTGGTIELSIRVLNLR